MKEEIIKNIGNPAELEKLYRNNKTTFTEAFNLAYGDLRENTVAQCWNERLNFENAEISWGTRNELTFVIVLSIIAGLIAKIPEFAGLKPEYFYPRNIAFIFFPLLIIYFGWKQKLQFKTTAPALFIILLSAVYINFLPDNPKSDTLMLACIHLPLLIWAVTGFAYTGDQYKNFQRRLDFLRYNGDLVVMTAVMLMAGALLTGVTIGLFELIHIRIQEFYFQYIATFGLAALPVIGTYLVQTNPQLVNKVSPVIAKIFTPLVLVMLIVYLIAVIYTGKDPYNDRDFLLIFNLLLIGVMAIILFSIAGTSKKPDTKAGIILLLSLSSVTIILNGIALSAIIFRISEWGLTPNRLAVLGGNILILTNLILVTYNLFRTLKNSRNIEHVENSIASYLPVYILWTIVVTFVFPVIYNFQ
jgi:hypothetical protein